VKVNATIDNIDPATAGRLKDGERYTVVLEWRDGDHIDTDLHFRLVEPGEGT
jgi:hypothetical protein